MQPTTAERALIRSWSPVNGASCDAVQARRSSPGRAFTTISGVTPHRKARSQPLRARTAGRALCASESIETRHPASTARRRSRFGGSSRSGRELTSIALSKRAAAAKTMLRVEGRGRPVAPAGLHSPGAVAEDVEVRVGQGGDHAHGHRPLGHAQLGVDAADHHVEPREQLGLLVERAVLVDVDLDAGQDPERLELLVERRDLVELGASAARSRGRWRRSAAASGR